MTTLWFSQDGRSPNCQYGSGILISVAEADAIFADTPFHFCEPEPPNINPSKPSLYNKNVVLEVGVEAETAQSMRFKRPGYYWLTGTTPEDAQTMLNAHRTGSGRSRSI